MTTIVLGLDGASWNLLDKLIKENELENLRKIKKDGVVADSKSCLPPVTMPNWKCYSTGKNPGKLGVFWWEEIDTKNKKLKLPNSSNFEEPEIWDYIGKEDKEVAILNMPTTYPPREVNGIMVSGGPNCQPQNYTYPVKLESKLKEKGYKPNMERTITSRKNSEKEIEEIYDLINKRFDLAKEILEEEEPDFLHLTIFYINVLQHFFWDDEPTKKGWEIIDDRIGELMENAERIFLFSDHGAGEIDTVFYVNEWLRDRGFLETKKTSKDLFLRFGINQEKVISIAKKFHLENVIKKIVPKSLANLFPEEEEGFKRQNKLEKIDWDETKAVASGQGLIYLTAQEGTEQYQKDLEEIINELEKLKSPISGNKIAKEVYEKEEIYDGPYLDKAPDIVFDQGGGVHTSDNLGGGDVFSPPTKWRGENKRTGIFAAYGEDIKEGEEIPGIEITDIAPTILHSMGQKIPFDMDGEPQPIFKKESEPAEKEPRYTRAITKNQRNPSEEKVKERLQDLGYM